MSTVVAGTPSRPPGLRPLQDVPELKTPGAAALARVDGVEGSWLQARLDDAFAVVAGCFFRRREVRVRARALADRELYLPRSWTGDPLLAAAGVPAGTGFATKPGLLQQMIKRAAAAGMPFGWVAADEAYGGHRPALSPPA